jgi:hypothetical protein
VGTALRGSAGSAGSAKGDPVGPGSSFETYVLDLLDRFDAFDSALIPGWTPMGFSPLFELLDVLESYDASLFVLGFETRPLSLRDRRPALISWTASLPDGV